MKLREENAGNGHKSELRGECHECKHLIQWPYCFAFMSGSGIPTEIREADSITQIPSLGIMEYAFCIKTLRTSCRNQP